MGPDLSNSDLELNHYWPLNRVQPLAGITASDDDESGLFAFMDWAINAEIYAIALRDNQHPVGTIVEACTGKVVAKSIAELFKTSL